MGFILLLQISMKKILLLTVALVIGSLISQAQTNVFEEIFKVDSSQQITPNNGMIDKFFDVPRMHTAKYTPSRPFDFKVGNTSYTLKTCIFEQWDDNLKNGFNVLGIYKENKLLLEVKQPDIWTYTYDGGSMMDYKMYTNNKYFIPVKLTNSSMALLFIGWPYGGDLPYLSIIVVTEKDVKLVLNKHLGLDSITTSPTYKMKVQTVLGECDSSGKLLISPKYAEIGVTKEGTLYYKK